MCVCVCVCVKKRRKGVLEKSEYLEIMLVHSVKRKKRKGEMKYDSVEYTVDQFGGRA